MEIEKNIPMPEQRAGRGKGELRIVLESMEVGDSVLIDDKPRAIISTTTGNLKPKKFSIRTLDYGIRVWRVE